MRARKIKPFEARLQRSPETLAEVWQECRGPLKQIASNYSRNAADVDDILQDSFIRAQTGRYVAKKGAFVTWAGTIVRRTAHDRSRRQFYKTRRGSDKILREVSMPECFEDIIPAAERAESSIDPGHVKKALARMRQDQRELLISIYLHGMSHAKVAADRHIPLGTVKGQSYKAVRSFVLCLQEILGDNAPRFVAARLRSS